MTAHEYRQILTSWTHEQRLAFGERIHYDNGGDIEAMVTTFRQNPTLDLQMVLLMQDRGIAIETEGARTAKATIDAAWYARFAFYAAIAGIIVSVTLFFLSR